jgi:hypothetical protein
MKLLRLGIVLLAAATVVACSKDTEGVLTTPDAVAGLRYVHVVPDYGAVDFRIVDVVINAPNQVGATFRTGGAPSGVTTTFLPPHQAVLAGARHIRVFRTGTVDSIASQVVLDTIYTFEQGKNYTAFMFGYTDGANGTPSPVRMLITEDVVPSLAANKVGVRLLHLAPTIAPNPEGLVDAWVVPTAAAAPLGGSATFANRAFGDISAYVALDTSASTGYKVAVTATGTNTPILFSANMLTGRRGNASLCVTSPGDADPTPGSYVAGTAMTAVVVPRSVAGSPATSFTTPSVIYLVDQFPPRTCP